MKHSQNRWFTPVPCGLLLALTGALSAAACDSQAELLALKDSTLSGKRGEEQVLWEHCDPEGGILEGSTGEACSFEGNCAALSECTADQASCQDGVLYRALISREACSAPPREGTAYCVESTDEPCCMRVYACDESAPSPPESTSVCALACENLAPDPALDPVTACPQNDTPWEPAPGTPCEGEFICDLLGHPFGTVPQGSPPGGALYWCAHGVVQRVELTGSVI